MGIMFYPQVDSSPVDSRNPICFDPLTFFSKLRALDFVEAPKERASSSWLKIWVVPIEVYIIFFGGKHSQKFPTKLILDKFFGVNSL